MNVNTPCDQDARLVPGDLLDEKETAAILKVAVPTLRNWRSLGQGPRYRKIGKRCVRYPRAWLAEFIEGQGGAV